MQIHKVLTVWILGWTTVVGTSHSRLNAVWWTESGVTMAVTKTIAYPVTIAIVRANVIAIHGRSKISHGSALLFHTHLQTNIRKKSWNYLNSSVQRCRIYLARRALGPIRRESRVGLAQSEIDYGRTARYYFPTVIDEGMAQSRDGFHAEFQPFVQMLAVQHTAENIAVNIPNSTHPHQYPISTGVTLLLFPSVTVITY